MSSKTTNYNLRKIDLTDSPADITVLNQNWDTIDAEMKALDDAVENLDVAQMGALLGTLPTITDANTSIADSNPTGIKIERWSKTTLNTPYTQGLTTRSDGVVITAVIKGTFATQLSFPIGGRGLYIRHNMVGSIYAWTEYGDFKADGSVPMTGTVLNMSNGEGSIENNGIDASIRVRKVANDDSNSTSLVLDNSFSTSPHRKLYLRDTVDGVNTDYKLYGEHNPPTDVCLPLDGSATMSGALKLNKDYFGYLNSYGTTGENGVSNVVLRAFKTSKDETNSIVLMLWPNNALANKLLLRDYENGIATGTYNIYGEHNKPSGSYTGNGSATSRTINTGGIGSAILIWSNNGYVSLCSVYGGFGRTANVTAQALSGNIVKFETGILTLTTDNVALNANGVTYHYQVL